MPLGVLIPAPAITITFLHFSSRIKLAISCTDDTEKELKLLWLLLLNFLFWGDTLFPRCGGRELGEMERFLNEDSSPESDWLFAMPFLAFLEPLTGLTFLTGLTLETLRCGDFLDVTGSTGSRRCMDRIMPREERNGWVISELPFSSVSEWGLAQSLSCQN